MKAQRGRIKAAFDYCPVNPVEMERAADQHIAAQAVQLGNTPIGNMLPRRMIVIFSDLLRINQRTAVLEFSQRV